MRKRELETSINRRAKRKIEHPTSMSVQVENYVNWNVQRNLTPKTIDSYSGHLGVLKQFLASQGHFKPCKLIARGTQRDV